MGYIIWNIVIVIVPVIFLYAIFRQQIAKGITAARLGYPITPPYPVHIADMVTTLLPSRADSFVRHVLASFA